MIRFQTILFLFLIPLSVFAQTIEELEVQIEEETAVSKKVKLLHQYVWELSYSNPRASIEPAREALTLSQELNDSNLIAQSYNRIGLVHDYAGNFELAETYYVKAYGIMLRNEGEEATDGILNNLGSIYYYLGRYSESMDYYLKSLKIRESKKDEGDPETLKKLSQSYNNIALLLKRQQNYQDAIAYYESALRIKSDLGDASGEIISRSNLGTLYMEQDSMVLANEQFQRAVEMSDSLQDYVTKAMLLNNLGLLKVREADLVTGEGFFNQSIDLYDQIGDQSGKATALLNLASLYLDKRNKTQALAVASQALEIGVSSGSADIQLSALQLLSGIEENRNPRQSLIYLRQYVELKDSVDAVEITKQVNQQAIMYETERKENEIELLKKDQTINQIKIEGQSMLIERNRNYIIFLVIGIVMLLLIGVSLVLYFRSRKEAAEERTRKLYVEHQREIDGLRVLLSKEFDEERQLDFHFGISQDDLNQYLLNPLSEREIEVLYKIAKGNTNKEIAAELFISVNTVKTHVLHIYEKLAVQNRTEAAVKASKMKILK